MSSMNLKNNVEEKFNTAFKAAFSHLVIQPQTIEITRSTHPRYGHYQCNSAMKLSKTLGMPPREIANQVIRFLQQQDADIEQCEVAGPGFINITLKTGFLNQFCQKMLKTPHFGIQEAHPQKIIVEFSSPNTAKEMHVGHLRSTIIGDCFARLLEFLGENVLRLNHIGDWGTAFGMLIAYLKNYESDLLTGTKKATLPLLMSYYKAAKKVFDEDAAFKKQSQLEVVSLQQGDPTSLQAWELICEISRQAYQEIYDLLDIRLQERGESFYNPFLAQVIEDLAHKNLLQLSDGAKCLFLEGFTNREGEPLPFMLQKSDGGYNYSTTDLASIRHRIEVEKADRLIYVTDAGQATHFAMLFAAAQKAGYLDPTKVRVDHVPFGLVLGPDGKKFKTRSGETERLMDLIAAAIFKAQEILLTRNQNNANYLTPDEIQHIGKILGINAIKYADLSGNRINDYVFSYDRMLRFEGNTAAFLMYSYVRIHGIKRHIKDITLAEIDLQHPTEVQLGLHLCQFAEILYSIVDDLMPNRLCDYLFELAEKFNAFFRDCRVEGSAEQNQRLALCELTAQVLKQGMDILGLQTVTKM